MDGSGHSGACDGAVPAALAGTDHPGHATQASLIPRYIAWRNRNTDNPRLRALVNTANVA